MCAGALVAGLVAVAILGLQGQDIILLGSTRIKGETARKVSFVVIPVIVIFTVGWLIQLAQGMMQGGSIVEALTTDSNMVCVALAAAGVGAALLTALTRPRSTPVDTDFTYCPNCRFEQWKGYKKCQKCGYKLAKP